MTSAQPDHPVDPWPDFAQLPQLAVVEMDFLCQHCGYNLRTQPIRRDPRTQVFLCRCPECGHFRNAADATSTAHAWLRRISAFLLLAWLLFVVSLAAGILSSYGGIMGVTLDELTRTRYYRDADGNHHYSCTVRQYREEDYWIVLGLLVPSSAALGFVTVQFAVVAFPHWRRRAYDALAIILPLLPGLVVWIVWRTEYPSLSSWGATVVFGYAMVGILGGITAAIIGRRLPRLIVRVLLPPRWRGALAYLWFADGKEPPMASKESSITAL